jgi:hypothetical protein
MPPGTFRNAGPAITDFDIRGVEQQVGVRFPDDVVQHYREVNGGIPQNPVWDDGTYELGVSHFLPMLHPRSDGRSVESTHQFLVSRALVDSDLVPFALDGGGNYFCFDASGAVYFIAMDDWEEDLSDAENRAALRRQIANTFSAFLDGLQPRPSEDE